MSEITPARSWLYRALYVGLCICILFAHLLPLDTLPRSWAPPDILLCLTFAWVVRRPEYVPLLLIAAVFLVMDLMFLRPPGLWAALVVIGSEYLRSQVATLRDTTYPLEFITVAAVIWMCFGSYRLILSILLIDQVQLSIFLSQVIFSFIAYSGVVLVSHSLLGVRKSSPTDLNKVGLRS